MSSRFACSSIVEVGSGDVLDVARHHGRRCHHGQDVSPQVETWFAAYRLTGDVFGLCRMTKYTQSASTYIADSGSLAEEVFSSIRTAQAFGAQKTLVDLFDAYVKKAAVVGINGARISSLGLAVMFFVIYAGYALAFFYGAILVRLLRSSAVWAQN